MTITSSADEIFGRIDITSVVAIMTQTEQLLLERQVVVALDECRYFRFDCFKSVFGITKTGHTSTFGGRVLAVRV